MSKLERWVTSGRGVVFLMAGDGERKVSLSLSLYLSFARIDYYLFPSIFLLSISVQRVSPSSVGL